MADIRDMQKRIEEQMNTLHAIQHQVLHRIHDLDLSLQKFGKVIGQITIHNCGTKRQEIKNFSELTFKIINDIDRNITNPKIEGALKGQLQQLHDLLIVYEKDLKRLDSLADRLTKQTYGTVMQEISSLISNLHSTLLPGLVGILQGLDRLDSNSAARRDNLIRAIQARLEHNLKAA